MAQVAVVLFFLVMFWGAIPLLNVILRKRGWPDGRRQAVNLCAWFGGIALAWLLLASF
jgi:hypothetical protein